MWYTEGKGDEDLAVHDFRRVSADEGGTVDPCGPGRFRTVLPNSPLSYEGVLFKLRWCVRVRAFLTRGRELVGQQAFRPGQCAAGQGGQGTAEPSGGQAGNADRILSRERAAPPPA